MLGLGRSSGHMPCSLCAELERRLGSPAQFRNATLGRVAVPRPELFDLHPVGIFFAERASRAATLGDLWPAAENLWVDLDLLHGFVWHSVASRATLRSSVSASYAWLAGVCIDLLDSVTEEERDSALFNCGHAAGHGNLVMLNASHELARVPAALARSFVSYMYLSFDLYVFRSCV